MARTRSPGILEHFEGRVAAWLDRRRRDRLLRRVGGIQRCPWCRQIAQEGEGWSLAEWEGNAFHDVLTCGVCGGTSVWHFAMGMHPVGPLAPPRPDPAFPNDIERDRISAESRP
jgi:hypothetical protein